MSEQTGIAHALVDAREHDRILTAYPGPVPMSLEDAYAIQDLAIELYGKTVGGWKLGRVRELFFSRYRADRLAGPIFADQIVDGAEGTIVGMPVLRGFAAVEAELLLCVGKPVPADVAVTDVPDYVSHVRFGLEIASSPLPEINDHGPALTASDFGNNYGLVLGPEVPDWRDRDLLGATATLMLDGETIGTGRAADSLDGPFGSVAFLARLLAKRDLPLPAGTWVSTGALTGVHQAVAGQSAEARFDGDLVVRCKLIPSSTANEGGRPNGR